MSKNSNSTLVLLEKLISFPTISSQSNLDLIHFIEDYFKKLGVETQLFLNEENTKANLFASIGPIDKPGIILSGHTDVVPIEGQNWSTDPFEMTKKNKKLFGRGTADMKGFIALCLSIVPACLNRELKEPLHFAFSYDEETGCTGCRSMIDHISHLKTKPRACIVGEPTSLKVVNSHKGIRSYWIKIKGRAGHSSAPDLGANAILAAADIINFIKKQSVEAQKFISPDPRFSPPYTTFNIGEIKGGNAINIIAEHTYFGFEFRPVPGFDGDKVLKNIKQHIQNNVLTEMHKTAPESSIEIEEISNVPPLMIEKDNEFENLMMLLTNTNDVEAVAYATEAGLFQTIAGIPTIVCGPGSIDQAHKPDEYIEIDQLLAAENFFEKLLKLICKK